MTDCRPTMNYNKEGYQCSVERTLELGQLARWVLLLSPPFCVFLRAPHGEIACQPTARSGFDLLTMAGSKAKQNQGEAFLLYLFFFFLGAARLTRASGRQKEQQRQRQQEANGQHGEGRWATTCSRAHSGAGKQDPAAPSRLA